MTKPTILLFGGYDKKSTYDEWIDAFHGKVRYLIVMGATAQALQTRQRITVSITSFLQILLRKQ